MRRYKEKPRRAISKPKSSTPTKHGSIVKFVRGSDGKLYRETTVKGKKGKKKAVCRDAVVNV